jgi:hypothetical protein
MNKSHYIALTLVMSLLSFTTAIAIFALQYFTVAYVTNAEGLSLSGFQIWDIHKVFTVLLVTTVLAGVAAFLWPIITKKTLSNKGLVGLLLSMYVLAVVFLPYPFDDFQIRHYAGPANSTYINLSANSADFIDGNEGIFMGSLQKMGGETIYTKLANGENDYAKEPKVYDCVVEQSYWFGHIGVLKSFHPILDEKNGDKLILQRCKPAKITIQ